MKSLRWLVVLLVLTLVATSVAPAKAQLGGTQKSSFTVQNLSDAVATVTVTFIGATGNQITPTKLGTLNNPFTLQPGESKEIYVPGITDLPPGSYSLMISSDQKIVATANVLGEGAVNFNGTYSGLDAGATTFYLPSFMYNYYNWYSNISVQNVGSSPTDVTVTVTCAGKTGTYTKTGLAAYASVTFMSNTTAPSWSGGSAPARNVCSGSAVVTSTSSPVVAVDNQTVPSAGYTQSFNGVAGGSQTMYAPVLFVDYYGWDSSINIQKLGSGNTTVTVAYSDGTPSSTCNLTDAAPGCLLYMPTAHPRPANQPRQLFAAKITSNNLPILAVVNAATDTSGQAQTYNTVSAGSNTVLAPGLFKNYYGWVSSVTCQNVGGSATNIKMAFNGYATPVIRNNVAPSGTAEFYVPGFNGTGGTPALPDRITIGATLTTVTSGGSFDAAGAITCVINHNNAAQMSSTVGDWSTSANAFAK